MNKTVPTSLYKSKMFVLLLLGITFFFTSCKKELTIKPCTANEEHCHEFDWSECLEVIHVNKAPFYWGATFNPLDPGEIIYYKSDSAGTSLMKLNLTTKEGKVLIKNFPHGFSSRPAWGRSGWIAFSSGMDHWKIWRLRDDGSDLKQISFKPDDQFPEFNYTGEKIIYSQNMGYTNAQLINSPELNLQRNNQIIDYQGNKIDSICQAIENYNCQQWTFSRWNYDNRILYKLLGNNKTGVVLYDYNSFARKELIVENLTGPNHITDIQWHPHETSFFYSTASTGIFQYHFLTGQVTKIKNACKARFYGDISVSLDGKKIIASRNDVEPQRGVYCYGIITGRIVIMDIDGCNESVIDLP